MFSSFRTPALRARPTPRGLKPTVSPRWALPRADASHRGPVPHPAAPAPGEAPFPSRFAGTAGGYL